MLAQILQGVGQALMWWKQLPGMQLLLSSLPIVWRRAAVCLYWQWQRPHMVLWNVCSFVQGLDGLKGSGTTLIRQHARHSRMG